MPAKKSAEKTAATSPWTPGQRKRLSAVRAGGVVPKGFYYDAASAWALLGAGAPMPDALSRDDELERARRHQFVSWTTRAGRCFTDESWNALVALWVHRAGWDLVFDLIIPRLDEPWSNAIGTVQSDAGAPWYAIRRYLHAATPEAFAQARRRVEPLMANPPPVARPREAYASEEAWLADCSREHAFARARAHVAFAFDRGTDWAHQLLRGYVERDERAADLPLLVAACTDADLAQAALAKWGGLREAYFVFDMVESMGARAAPLLEPWPGARGPDKQRVAEARAIAEALAAAQG